MADRTGLEPATSGVTGRHSNRLNYRSAETFSDHSSVATSATGGRLYQNSPRYQALFKTCWHQKQNRDGGPDGTRTRDLRRDRPAF